MYSLHPESASNVPYQTNDAHYNSGHSKSGFTLIEFMFVLLLSGVVVGATLSLFDQFREQKRIEENIDAVARLNGAIQSYFIKFGHYPCPAALTEIPGDVNFGSATDCYDSSATGVVRSTRFMDTDFDSVPDTNVAIRWGSVPFRTLTINQPPTGRIVRFSESDSYDPYNRRYSYIVTEKQATLDYQEGGGALYVEDEHGRYITDNEDFILVSHGPDGIGAYTPGGIVERPCGSEPGKDEENCNGDYKFIQAPIYLSEGTSHFDDSLTFMTWFPYYLWQQSDVDPQDIHNKNTGNVGIGTKSPQAKLHIEDGNFSAFFWPDWGDPTTKVGSVGAENLCDPTKTSCFSPGLFGTGSKAECGSGRINNGIRFASGACTDADMNTMSHGCGPDEYIKSMTYNVTTQQLSFTCLNPRL